MSGKEPPPKMRDMALTDPDRTSLSRKTGFAYELQELPHFLTCLEHLLKPLFPLTMFSVNHIPYPRSTLQNIQPIASPPYL
jgi:hypothetical protein